MLHCSPTAKKALDLLIKHNKELNIWVGKIHRKGKACFPLKIFRRQQSSSKKNVVFLLRKQLESMMLIILIALYPAVRNKPI